MNVTLRRGSGAHCDFTLLPQSPRHGFFSFRHQYFIIARTIREAQSAPLHYLFLESFKHRQFREEAG
ncbi:hypothetical protein RB195_020451 [Necator americanus]|uniref:Uncharacterized protein n=1 Tax=Necator americanus TaxID=51031 RepID=A0ABR1CJ88_NECAM